MRLKIQGRNRSIEFDIDFLALAVVALAALLAVAMIAL